ncbi:PstS family phosphate ABC transporter substrate-binding protein [Nocardioides limicola]|uniref:PstS family phosphate ABC transporter substrate-binding protein n=1 Tax=Nocardioides limicola TaxID=2803368 RepID=UPI00193BD54B|nr:PstS family phosphate ABC transporter substrate-binding protein [Nocardioides sp. DJM-14]
MNRTAFRRAAVPGIAALALALTACGGSGGTDADVPEGLSGEIKIDGSSTVTPHTIPAAELFFEATGGSVKVPVATSGTGGGFAKFCAGETDISMASRPIKQDEADICAANGIEYVQLGISNDGLAVAINNDNDWATCFTVDELNAFWADGSTVSTWQDVNPEWPAEEVRLFGPGHDSGTFDFFTEVVNGESGNINTGYTDIGEDDNAAIEGVAGSVGAMSFVPLSYVLESGGKVQAAAIENSSGECVEPSLETVRDGSYEPLGRQLFIYPSGSALERDEVKAFIEFYVANQEEIALEAKLIPLTDEQVAEVESRVAELTAS